MFSMSQLNWDIHLINQHPDFPENRFSLTYLPQPAPRTNFYQIRNAILSAYINIDREGISSPLNNSGSALRTQRKGEASFQGVEFVI